MREADKLGDHTELSHHSQVIIIAPVFHDLLIGDAKEMHSSRRDVLARGGDAKKLSSVGEVIGTSDHHQVPFSNLMLNRVVEIRKRRVIQRYDLFMPLATGSPIRRIGVIDVVW